MEIRFYKRLIYIKTRRLNALNMLQQLNQISEADFISDIVAKDYRTAVVFWKYNIDFCCGGRLPLEKACVAKGVNAESVTHELEQVIQQGSAAYALKYNEWNLDFLMDYIIYVHHAYLKTTLPLFRVRIQEFGVRHEGKYSYLPELLDIFRKLEMETWPHLIQEEEIAFPYIRQMEYAYNNKEAYAGLLVRTLSKPVEELIKHNHGLMTEYLKRIREITKNYTPPANACITHKVVYALLGEMDCDLSQHLHLENDILLPKAIAMEKELLLLVG
jgi:regulator of cell morphogenesis and NO signaling